MIEKEFIETVHREIAEALGMGQSEVLDEALLKRDLGAESIDFIDLTFRFEKLLACPLAEQDIFRSKRPDGDVSVHEVIDNLRFVKHQKPGT